jgi:hypothetical protein
MWSDLGAALRAWADGAGAAGILVISVVDSMALPLPNATDALILYLTVQQPELWWWYAAAGHPFIGTRPDLLYQRDYFTAVIEMARGARRDGTPRDALTKVEVLPKFEHFGGQKPRLGLALTIAYDELAKKG